MTLADAFLYAVVGDEVPDGEVAVFCADAIAGGVDVLQVGRRSPERLRQLVGICRRDDALLIIESDAGMAAAVKADGVLLDGMLDSIGLARTRMPSGVVGVAVRGIDQAALAIEVGADFVLHGGGVAAGADFLALKGQATMPMFAAGIEGLAEARTLVEGGVYRLGLSSRALVGEHVRENAAAFSRLLGRSL